MYVRYSPLARALLFLLTETTPHLPLLSSFADLMCFGDSAGAYGSVVYCAIIAEAARARGLDVNIAVVADSGVGLAAVSPTWGIENGALVHVSSVGAALEFVRAGLGK